MSQQQSDHRDEMARILEPDSVAIVGASQDDSKRGYQTIASLQDWGYEGTIYPVNPKYEGETILGLDVYAKVADIPGPVDLACVLTPAHIVPEVIEDCGDAGVEGALVIAAGYSEVGNDELQSELISIARNNDVRIVGPNVDGLVNIHQGLDLLGRREIPIGDLAIVSQSGNIALELIYEALGSGRGGFSFYIPVGNEVDVRFDEYLSFLATHDQTNVGTLYAEGMRDGAAFLREASEFVTKKPIAILKSGRTAAGKQSARSHTASIAGRTNVIEDVYRQAGLVQVDRVDELLAVSIALADQPPADGLNVGILGDGGGPATHAADSLSEHGLNVPDLETKTQKRIREWVPEKAPNVENPIDTMTFAEDLDLFYECADAVLEDPNIDALLLCGYFGGYGLNYPNIDTDTEAAVVRRLKELPAKHGKPVVAQSMFAEMESPGIEELVNSSIPVFKSINYATECVVALAEYGTHRRHAHEKSDFVKPAPEPHAIVTDAVSSGRSALSEPETRTLLEEYGAPVGVYQMAESREEAAEAVASFDGPVAMKIVSRDILHKTEAGGVKLNVTGAGGAREAYDELVENARRYAPNANHEGVIVTEMVDGDLELVIGLTHDEEIGPVVMVGLGGIYVEVVEDVAFRGLPLTEYDANAMLDELDVSAVLEGARGGAPLDRAAITNLLLTISEIACRNPELRELDLNPVAVSVDGIDILDAVASFKEE